VTTHRQALLLLYAIQQCGRFSATPTTFLNQRDGIQNGIRRQNRETAFRLYMHGWFHGCLACGALLATGTTGDHLIPSKLGGSDSANNYLPLCGRCNSSKGTIDFLEWWTVKKKRRATELPHDVICAYSRLWWEHHEAANTLDDPAPPAMLAAVRELADRLPLAHRNAAWKAVGLLNGHREEAA
jgi:hypothetical protein